MATRRIPKVIGEWRRKDGQLQTWEHHRPFRITYSWSVEEFITELRKASADFVDDTIIDIDTIEEYGDTSAHIVVSGWRNATDGELADAKQAYKDWEARREEARGNVLVHDKKLLEMIRQRSPELFDE